MTQIKETLRISPDFVQDTDLRDLLLADLQVKELQRQIDALTQLVDPLGLDPSVRTLSAFDFVREFMSDVTDQARDVFYARQRTATVPLCIDDAVLVKAGLYRGRVGSVISIESIGNDPTFLIEFGDSGQDTVLPYSLLELME